MHTFFNKVSKGLGTPKHLIMTMTAFHNITLCSSSGRSNSSYESIGLTSFRGHHDLCHFHSANFLCVDKEWTPIRLSAAYIYRLDFSIYHTETSLLSLSKSTPRPRASTTHTSSTGGRGRSQPAECGVLCLESPHWLEEFVLFCYCFIPVWPAPV